MRFGIRLADWFGGTQNIVDLAVLAEKNGFDSARTARSTMFWVPPNQSASLIPNLICSWPPRGITSRSLCRAIFLLGNLRRLSSPEPAPPLSLLCSALFARFVRLG